MWLKKPLAAIDWLWAKVPVRFPNLQIVLPEGGVGWLTMAVDWVEHTKEPAVKAALIARTQAAKAAGVFGVPTWIVDETYLFWGQDRLELVMRALGGWKPVHG